MTSARQRAEADAVRVLRLVAAHEIGPAVARDAGEALRRLEPYASARRSPRRKERAPGRTREERRNEKRGAERANRAAVLERAAGGCERETGEPGLPLGPCGMRVAERDHFWGRARDESVEGSWGLCRLCHRAKTENRPSRAYWLWSFGRHAMRHGYDEQVAKVGRAMVLEIAQHPEHKEASGNG